MHLPFGARAQRFQFVARLMQDREHFSRVTNQALAVRRRRDALGGTLKKRKAEAALQLRQRFRNRRHRHVRDVGHLGQIAVGVDRHQQAQVPRLQIDLQVPVER